MMHHQNHATVEAAEAPAAERSRGLGRDRRRGVSFPALGGLTPSRRAHRTSQGLPADQARPGRYHPGALARAAWGQTRRIGTPFNVFASSAGGKLWCGPPTKSRMARTSEVQ
ncbi:hypothetical protein ACIP80_28785 [Streptomyces sp. NPDC088555]|uniref:hypothetical protein n=1 Tax=Streptomyces sp. NPDC088555 TaxID=3365866 RepID=UPI00380E6CDB